MGSSSASKVFAAYNLSNAWRTHREVTPRLSGYTKNSCCGKPWPCRANNPVSVGSAASTCGFARYGFPVFPETVPTALTNIPSANFLARYGWWNHITFTEPDASVITASPTGILRFQDFLVSSFEMVPKIVTDSPATSPVILDSPPPWSYRAGKWYSRSRTVPRPSFLRARNCTGVRRKCFESGSPGDMPRLYPALSESKRKGGIVSQDLCTVAREVSCVRPRHK